MQLKFNLEHINEQGKNLNKYWGVLAQQKTRMMHKSGKQSLEMLFSTDRNVGPKLGNAGC